MTDDEKFDLILSKMQNIESDMQSMKSDMQNMKSDMQNMKSDMQIMETDIKDIDRKLTDTRLHIENATDKNIQLLAENFVELTKKLNQAIPVADKNLAYEIKVNYLLERVEKLETDVKALKSKIA